MSFPRFLFFSAIRAWLIVRPIDRTSTYVHAFTVTVLTALSKVLGFVREALIAHIFGTAAIVDAYRVGETITTVGGGFVSSTFDVAALPLLVENKI